MDSENYWYFGVWINNETSSTISIDMKTGMKLYYEENNNWVETTNHDLIYENTWEIPPNSVESSPWTLVFSPNERNENITYRVFLIGQVDNNSQDQLVGSMEYVIQNNNLVEVNSLSTAVNQNEMDQLFSEALSNWTQLILSPSNTPPLKDENGYWLFRIFLNNFTDYDISVGSYMGLRIFYQDGEQWFETTNHDVYYPEKTSIPPNRINGGATIIYVRPNIQRENLVIRIFVFGSVENASTDRIVGMIEYVISDDQFSEVNYIRN